MRILVVILIVGAFALGYYAGQPQPAKQGNATAAKAAPAEPQWYTCSMHPKFKLPDKDAKCPICAMDLIPLSANSSGDEGPRQLSLTEGAAARADIATALVKRQFVDMELQLSGLVSFDETRVKTLSAWVGGRLDRLFVDYEGVAVKPGDRLIKLYSPELYSAQVELLQAIEAYEEVKDSDSPIVIRSAKATVDAANEKLRLLGLTAAQVKTIQKRKSAKDTIEVRAPLGGVVIKKHAAEGQYVKTGNPIYTLADLSKLWVWLDVYESDLSFIRYGQEVEITTEAYGDETFKGWISFIDPVLNKKTRSVRVRVIVNNERGRLKPNMFVSALVKVKVGAKGAVVDSTLKGKWVSPRHPEVVRDKPGSCPHCGIRLVSAEQLGYATGEEAKPPLIVPATAVLITGKRAVAYLKDHEKDEPTFNGVEVKLGARVGDYYIVRKGLQEDDEVVVEGAFKLDSALQILSKPSMMYPPPPPEDERNRLDVDLAFLAHLTPVYQAYLQAQERLAADDDKGALKAYEALEEAVGEIDGDKLNEEGQQVWLETMEKLLISLAGREDAEGLGGVRQLFYDISDSVITLEQYFGHSGEKSLYKAFCPMAADNKGAPWLQKDETIANPYFGSQMLRCGVIKHTFEPRTAEGR